MSNQRHPDRRYVPLFVHKDMKASMVRVAGGNMSALIRRAIARELRRLGKRVPPEWEV